MPPKLTTLTSMAALEVMKTHANNDPYFVISFITHNCRRVINTIMHGLQDYVNNLPDISCNYNIVKRRSRPENQIRQVVHQFSQISKGLPAKDQQYWQTMALLKIILNLKQRGINVRLEEHLHTAIEDMDGTTGAMRIYPAYLYDDFVDPEFDESDEAHYNPKWSEDAQHIDGPWLIRHLKDNAPEEGWGNREIAIPHSDTFPNAKVTAFKPSTGMATVAVQDGMTIKTPLYAMPCVISDRSAPHENARKTTMVVDHYESDENNHYYCLDPSAMEQ